MQSKDKKTVSLVLGSGGARGLAHIGVIDELEDAGFEIRSISGCSIGALVGGIYAVGKLKEFEEWVRSLTQIDVLKLMDISWPKGGLATGDEVFNSLSDLIGDPDIESLTIGYTAVATDILNEKEIWITSGQLLDAIRASIALPLFFSPIKYGETYLVDGGVINPVPVAPVLNDETNCVIAVNLAGDKGNVHSLNQAEREKIPVRPKLPSFMENIRSKLGLQHNANDEREFGLYDIANLAFDTMQSTITRHKLSAYPPDFTISIAREAAGILEFEQADELIKLGREGAKKCIEDMKSRPESSN